MDDAKVVINLKEGIIELQGPVDFVRQYLDTYQFAIKELRELPKDEAPTPQKAKVLPRKKKEASRPKAGKALPASALEAIRAKTEEGFFNQPRSTSEVKQQLNDNGLSRTSNAVRTVLGKLSKDGILDRVGKGKSIRYQRHGQSAAEIRGIG